MKHLIRVQLLENMDIVLELGFLLDIVSWDGVSVGQITY